MVGDDVDELVELFLVGQLAVQDQVRHFQEAALLGELLDGVAAVLQYPLVAVDVSDAGAAARRGHEAGVVSELPGLGVERADVDHIRAHRAGEHREIHRRRAVAEAQGCQFLSHDVLPISLYVFVGRTTQFLLIIRRGGQSARSISTTAR